MYICTSVCHPKTSNKVCFNNLALNDIILSPSENKGKYVSFTDIEKKLSALEQFLWRWCEISCVSHKKGTFEKLPYIYKNGSGMLNFHFRSVGSKYFP